MRTTVEIRDDLRGDLLALAAKRGEKGFSRLVGEAIEAYLQKEARREEERKRAFRTRGKLNDQETEDLRRGVAEIRGQWR